MPDCECGLPLPLGDLNIQRHLSGRRHAMGMETMNQKIAVEEEREQWTSNQVSKTEQTLAQKRDELKALDSQVSSAERQVAVLLNSAKLEAEKIVKDAQARGHSLFLDRSNEAKLMVETARNEIVGLLNEIEDLKAQKFEFQRVNEIQRVLSATRTDFNVLNSSLNKILADVVLTAPLLEGTKNFFSGKDLRSEARDRLLALAKQKGWKGE